MTTTEVLALANAVCDPHENDVEFARDAVETLLLQIPQIQLKDDDRVWFDQIVDTYDTQDYINNVFKLGQLTSLGSRMGLWTEEEFIAHPPS